MRFGVLQPGESTNNTLIDFLRDYAFSQARCLKDNTAGKHLQHCKVPVVINQLSLNVHKVFNLCMHLLVLC